MKRTKILHLSNNFYHQKIYINLVRELNKLGYKQVVYTAIKDEKYINGNKDDTLDNVEFHYAHILSSNIIKRIFYKKKIKNIFEDLQQRVDLDSIDLIHAHFLFSDGGVAYIAKKLFNTKYVVSVRSTDIDYFFKYMPHLRNFGNKILLESEAIIFINYSHKEIFLKKYARKMYLNDIINKIKVIPNAVDQKWFEHKISSKVLSSSINLIYVGRLIKRKKVDIAIKAVKELQKRGFDIKLHIVGNGPFYKNIKKMSNENIIFHGEIKNIDSLMQIYAQCDIFIMTSIKETFGLVYLEAMTQGLPIVHCKNEAVDGYFDDAPVSFAVNPNSYKEVAEKIIDYLEKYEELSEYVLTISKSFNWTDISQKFNTLYRTALTNKAHS